MIATLAALLLVFALAGSLPLEKPGLPQRVSMAYWALSFVGQGFALPLALLATALLLAIAMSDTAHLWGTALALAALALSVANHLRNHREGKWLLAAVPDSNRTSPVEPVPPLSGLRPLSRKRPGVRRIADISYGDAPNRRNLLDVFVPENPPSTPMPIIVQIHGGAWVMGEKEHQGQSLLYYLAARGWMGVAINYRLGPGNRIGAIFGDVLRAIAWVKQNAAQYGGDARFVAVTGGSAGGHLASLCALMQDHSMFKPGFEDSDTSVAAAVPVYARFDLVDRAGALGSGRAELVQFFVDNVMPCRPDQDELLWDVVSPVAQVNRDAPPFFVITSRHDCLLPCAEARHFADALRAVSRNPVLYAELGAGQHGYDILAQPLTEYQARAIERFLLGVLYRDGATA